MEGLTRKDEMRDKIERATGVYMSVNEDCEPNFSKADRFSREPVGFSIIIPMYNEAENVSPLLSELQTALTKLTSPYEIIVVNDASNDGTAAELNHQLNKINHLKVVTHKTNYGQSAGVLSGARAAQYYWLITLDGDGQNDPNDIPAIINTLQSLPKDKLYLIAGNRKKRHDSWLKRFSSRFANHVRAALLKDDCLDTGCSLKCFPREIFLQLPHFKHLHRYLPALFKRQGLSVINVPVNHRPRTRGYSKYGLNNRLWVGVMDILGMRWLIKRSCNPQTISSNEQ